MIPRFATLAQAIAQGYRSPVKSRDEDISGPNHKGYVYQDKDGNMTVPVWFDLEPNGKGGYGIIKPMFKPR